MNITATPHDHPEVVQLAYATDSTFLDGAPVVYTAANGTVAEGGADPASILGFTLSPAGGEVEAGTTLIAKAANGKRFWFACATDPVAGDDGKSYGLVKDADGVWLVDRAETVNTRVQVHQVDLIRKMLLVSVLAANVQVAP